MKNKFSLKKVLILVTILAVPGFLYYLLQEKGKNRYRPLEIYGAKQVASTFHTKRGKKIPDTIYHQIRNFKLVSESGDSLGFPLDSNRIAVVSFFFTKCKSYCKEMNTEMARIAKKYKRNRLLQFYSITVDPENDTPDVLQKYAKSFNADSLKWNFLTGDKDFIYNLAKKDFLVDAFQDKANEGNIIHSPMFIIVDSERRIRGFYDSRSKEQVDNLIDEITVQISEELRKTDAENKL